MCAARSVLVAVLLATGCATSGISRLDAETSRPILYLDLDRDKLVFRGVYPDGSRLTLRNADYEGLAETGAIPIWSPDGKRFAYLREDGRSRRVSLKLGSLRGDAQTLFTVERAASFTQPMWSPDGREVAVGLLDQASVPSVIVVDVGDRRIRSRYELPVKFATEIRLEVRPRFRWSPDGQKILVASAEGTFAVDTLNGVVETVLDEPVLGEWGPRSDGIYYFEVLDVSGRERQVLGDFCFKSLGAPTPIKLLDQQRIKLLGVVNLGAAPSLHGTMALSPRGGKLALWGTDFVSKQTSSVIYIYDLTRGQPLALNTPFKTFRSGGGLLGVEWAPDEKSLAAVADLDRGFGVKLLDLETGIWTTLARVADGVSAEARQGIAMIYSFHPKSMSWTQ
jgi:Tol biopolymer transport system component